MIIFKRYGHTFRIRNDDWKNIRERFNPKNAVSQIAFPPFVEHWKIGVPCSFCSRYRLTACEGCPIHKFGGCSKFFSALFRESRLKIGTLHVRWEKPNNVFAQRQLNHMQKIMDDIEKNQKEATCQKKKQKTS